VDILGDTQVTKSDQERLARMRADNLKWSALMDTSTWESTFFLAIIDELNEKLRRLNENKKDSHR
jgi:hypothetical protein